MSFKDKVQRLAPRRLLHAQQELRRPAAGPFRRTLPRRLRANHRSRRRRRRQQILRRTRSSPIAGRRDPRLPLFSRGIEMRFARIFLACLLLVCAVRTQAQDNGGKKILGIMPVYDTSGDSFGQQFAQNLTAMVYEKLQDAPFQVMLLNPGGLSSPLMPESDAEYIQSTGVSTLLVATLKP